MTQQILRKTTVALSALAVALAGAAHAQETAQAEDAGALNEIIVTAQKRTESAQDIPVSVAALSGDALVQAGAKDLFQAVTLVPGVVFSRAPDDGLALTFRGLGTTPRPQAFEQSVALFTDGVFIGKGRLYSTSFFDVDRMEFIKGTQSTLLGKNASLGAISIVTRQPGDSFGVEARAGAEFEYGGYTLDAAADLPIGEETALRVAGHYNDLDGWVRNDVTGNDGAQHKDLGLRATLRSEVSDALTVTASYQYADNKQIGVNYQVVGDLPAGYGEGVLDGHTQQFTSATDNGDTYHRIRSHIANLKGELELGDHTLVSQTSYIRYKLGFVDDFDFTAADSFNLLRNEHYKQFSQELRIQSPTNGSLEYMAGLFFMDSNWKSVEDQNWAFPSWPPAPAPISGQLFNGPFTNRFVQDSKAYSAFASGTFHVSDTIRLAGGLRYTRETKDVVFGRAARTPLTIWNTVANPSFDPTPLSHNANFLDGNISLQYDFTPDVMGYASFGHGSKSGGFVETNTVAVPPELHVGGKVPAALVRAGTAIKNEYTKTYEVGFKASLLDRKLRLNVAAFWTDIKNFQDTVFTGGPLGFITFNGPARSRGVEIETAFQVTPEFRLDGGLTYSDSTGVIQPIDPATAAPQVDANGDAVFARYRRPQAPKIIFNLSGTWEASLTDSLDYRLNASVRRRGGMYNQRQELFRTDSLTTLDLSAGIEAADGRWGLDLAARNVTNAISEDFASPNTDPLLNAVGAYAAGPNAQRTITLTAKVKF